MSMFGDWEAEVHFANQNELNQLDRRLESITDRIEQLIKDLYLIRKDIEKIQPFPLKEIKTQLSKIKRMEFPEI